MAGCATAERLKTEEAGLAEARGTSATELFILRTTAVQMSYKEPVSIAICIILFFALILNDPNKF